MIRLLAAEGGYQAFHLGGADKTWLYICLIAGLVGIGAGLLLARNVLAADQTLAQRAGLTTPIAQVHPRQRVRVAGRVKSVRVQPRAGTQNLECVLSDGTGGLLLVFQGRPKIAGIEPGARLVAEGMVGTWGRRPAMLNPSFELVQGATSDPAEG